VERCQGAGCASFAQVASPAGTMLSDTGLAAATSYSYRIRAQNAAGMLSGYSPVVSATTLASLSAPTNLTATETSNAQINLTWNSSAPAGVTYLVERCQGSGCANFAQIATPTATAFNDTGLTAATSYSYRVRAQDTGRNLSGYSNVASASTPAANISVSITPSRGGLTVSQTLNVSAVVANDVGGKGVSWTASTGSFTAQSATSATYVAPGTAGVITITATSIVDNTRSITATLGVTDLGAVATYHNDNARDGANTQEYALTTANVSTATFGKLFSCTVDGAVYAQPLWVAYRTINGAQHNVVIVATMHDSVYAFDADTSPCVMLWHANLLDMMHGGTANETSVPSGVANFLVGSGTGDIKPEVGVTGTPVIDPVANTIFVVSKSAVNNALPVYQRLHALSLFDGSEKPSSPVSIDASFSVPGNADGDSSVSFDPRNENQRCGLALVNGTVYVAWASHEDHGTYHGWVIGFNASTLATAGLVNTTPNQVTGFNYSRGGIWMSGGAPAADASGNLYLSTGNGTFDAYQMGNNYGDSTLKLGTAGGLSVLDWFTPADQSSLNLADLDHGAGGATVLLNTSAGNYMVVGGKEGTLFLLSQDVLGNYGANFNPVNSNAQQVLSLGNDGIYSTAGFWNNSLYIAGAESSLQLLTFNTASAKFNTPATSVSNHQFTWPGASPSISASGATNGIVWATDNGAFCTQQSPGCGPAVLYALDAGNLNELWNSSGSALDQAGLAVKFTLPTVANGKVYIGTRGNDTGAGTSSIRGELDVYGLKPN
jgi:Fibronectin type III domain